MQILSQTRLHVDCVLWQETPNSGVLCVGGMQMLSSNRCEILNCLTTTTPSAQRVLNQGSLCWCCRKYAKNFVAGDEIHDLFQTYSFQTDKQAGQTGRSKRTLKPRSWAKLCILVSLRQVAWPTTSIRIVGSLVILSMAGSDLLPNKCSAIWSGKGRLSREYHKFTLVFI